MSYLLFLASLVKGLLVESVVLMLSVCLLSVYLGIWGLKYVLIGTDSWKIVGKLSMEKKTLHWSFPNEKIELFP